jgi:hypothetical protein
MGLSIAKRREACLRLLRNQFDIEATIKWAIKAYADDPAMERAMHKERLARNIITIGGSGDQQQLNLVAFQQALTQFAAEQMEQAERKHQKELGEVKTELNQMREQLHETESERRGLTAKVQDLQEQRHVEMQKALAASVGSESALG